MSPDVTLILWDTASFAAKAFFVFLTIAFSAIVLFSLSRKTKRAGARVEIKVLHERYRNLRDSIRQAVMDHKAYRKLHKEETKKLKEKEPISAKIYVLDFHGDIMASAVESLRQEISGILGVIEPQDEVLVRIESPGGVVPGYGLAASQLRRLRDAGVRVVASVDKVAASGGYMMACVANEILTAPFAVLGSIGVAAPVPNIHRLLNKHGIDYEDMTAGEYKRTVSPFGEITEEGRRKFQEQLEDTHVLFKEFVRANRPQLDVDKVATGEFWHGSRAVELGLADRVITSDDYLISKLDNTHIYEVHYKPPKSIREKLRSAASALVEGALQRLGWAAPGGM